MSSDAIASLSPRKVQIGASPASVLRRRARELREAGRPIIELSSGNLDFPTPEHVVAAAHEAARRGDTRYTDVDGTPELKDAVRTALNGPQDVVRERASVLQKRRNFFVEMLNACEGLSCRPPEGTFYLLVSCAGVIGKRSDHGRETRTDRDFAAYLLERADLVVVAGEDFGLSPYIRVSFANPPELLEEAGRRLKRACAALS